MKDATLTRILEARAARVPVAVITRVADGLQGLVSPDSVDAFLPL